MLAWLHLLAAQFATGLLLTGLLFDVLGQVKKTERFLYVGFWNNLLGAAAAAVAVFSGFVSDSTLGPHDALGDASLRFHKMGGIVVLACSAAIALTRVAMKGGLLQRTRTAYLAVSLFGAVLLLGTNAIGTALVFTFGLGVDRGAAQRIINAQPGATTPVSPTPRRAAAQP